MVPNDDMEADDVEQYRDFIVEGDIYQALDLSRRLLHIDGDPLRRNEAARLLLDRLRSNRDDTRDHINALLRVLANYATPTKEVTEELLSLLFFCDHREEIIHHLSKLTYQSRECVWLIVDAYIELISSDRSLLVPILGSLADLPLVTTEKTLVVDATESLLDAASEEDIPAVVQSLLTMLVPSAAPRIVTKIRSQCNRLTTTATLSLTFDVIMRHSIAGSGVLTAFLRVIRHSDILTPFDTIFIALLLARPSENAAAARVVASLASKGVLTRTVVHDTLQRVRDQKWNDAFPCFVRLSSALLSACFNTVRSSSISTTVQSAVHMLGYLVAHRTSAQEEAVSLMMSMVSQPQRLILSTTRKRFLSTAQVLCWDVARAVADRLDQIATVHPTSLAPFAHIFLDHLYGITATSNQSFNQGDDYADSHYPANILAGLCRTMILLAKQEPGMLSLLMITIQKQLVVPVGGIAMGAHGQNSSLMHVKQLMAIFLANQILIQGAGEKVDRSSLLSWIQKLLASATVSDEATAHVVRVLGSSSITKPLSLADRDATFEVLSAVFNRHGFEVKKQSAVVARYQSVSSEKDGVDYLAGLADQSSGWVANSLVFDVIMFVRAARLGDPPIGWHVLDGHDQSRSAIRSVESTIRGKIGLLHVMTEAFLSTPSLQISDCDAQDDKALMCSFALPSVTDDTFDPRKLPHTLWCYVCALQLGIITTNTLATKQHTKSTNDAVRQRKRLLSRVQVCWVLHKRLRALVDEAASRLQKSLDEEDQTQQARASTAWAKHQVDIIEKQFDPNSNWPTATFANSNLCSLGERLSLQAASAVFEGLWKQVSDVESGLEIELFRAFPARLAIQNAENDAIPIGVVSIQTLVSNQEGKRTLKYLARRLLDYCELLASLDGQDGDDNSDAQESDVDNTRHWVLIGVETLCNALRSVIGMCRIKQAQRVASGPTEDDDFWDEVAMELLAKGANDVRIKHAGSTQERSGGWATNCEIIFASLTNAVVQAKLGDVACELMDVLLSLTTNTRVVSHLALISLALLHTPFHLIQPTGQASKLIQKLPLSDPTVSATLTNTLRPVPRKFHHLIYFIVGAWAIPSTLQVGLTHLSYILECVDALVSSTLPNGFTNSRLKDSRKQTVQKTTRSSKEPVAEDDIVDWIARDGEHRVLKNLTHDTLPLFLETLIACLTAAPLRAIPSAITVRRDANPFDNLIGVLAIMSKCLQVIVAAEMSGIALPQRTSSSVLRCGPIMMRNTEQALKACLTWREEGSGDSHSVQVGDLEHLHNLLSATEGLVAAVQDVATSFEERVVLTMQKNTQLPASSKGDEDNKRGNSGRWNSDLLRKTFRKQYQRRKPLSRSEAKLLPHFTHSAEQLKASIAETSKLYRLELDNTRVSNTLSNSLQALQLREDQLEDVLQLLVPNADACDVINFDTRADLVSKWGRLTPTEEDEQGSYDGEFDEVDDEDDEQDDTDELKRNVFSNEKDLGAGTKKRVTVHTLIPQRKRVKSNQVAHR